MRCEVRGRIFVGSIAMHLLDPGQACSHGVVSLRILQSLDDEFEMTNVLFNLSARASTQSAKALSRIFSSREGLSSTTNENIM